MKKTIVFGLLLAVSCLCAAENMQKTAFLKLQQRAAEKHVALSGSAADLHSVSATGPLQMFAFEQGGFAILNREGEMLAYSFDNTLTDSLSPAFVDWSRLAQGGVNPEALEALDLRQAAAVAPLLLTEWGQSQPYNNELVFNLGGSNYRFVTGCGATALAQVMKYYNYPQSGRDSHSYKINYSNVGAVEFACNFAERTYDWANMTNTYQSTSWPEERAAVAMIMRDAGYALEMSYNGNASSSILFNQAAALRNFFGYSKHVRYYERSQKSAAKWAQMIYDELAAGRPIIFGATDALAGGGHAFIIDGYDEEGLVHVNWGWEGAGNGYYQIALLNPVINSANYEYSVEQMMVVGIQPDTETLVSKTVVLETPGSLRSQLTDDDMTSLQSLTVSGALNAADVLCIRRLAGFDSLPNTFTDGVLTSLDLTNARFTTGGGCYYDSRSTKANELPACWMMTVNPETNIVANYGGLSEIKLPAEGLTGIGAQSLANQKAITSLEIPASVSSIGVQGLWNMGYHLRELKVWATTPAQTDNMAFASYTNVAPFLECRVYVPDGSVSAYQESNQYWRFFENILGLSSYPEEEEPGEEPVTPPVSSLEDHRAQLAKKVLREGVLYIVRPDGRTYTASGLQTAE